MSMSVFSPSGFLGTYLSASSPADSQVPQSHWFCKLPCTFTGRPPADSVYFGSSPLFFPFWRGRHRGRAESICLGLPSALGFRPEEKERKKGERKEEMKKDLIKSMVDEWREGHILGLVQRSEVTALLNGCACRGDSIPPLSAEVVFCFCPQACVFLGMGTKERTPTGW